MALTRVRDYGKSTTPRGETQPCSTFRRDRGDGTIVPIALTPTEPADNSAVDTVGEDLRAWTGAQVAGEDRTNESLFAAGPVEALGFFQFGFRRRPITAAPIADGMRQHDVVDEAAAAKRARHDMLTRDVATKRLSAMEAKSILRLQQVRNRLQ
jgi:hypothetical protein